MTNLLDALAAKEDAISCADAHADADWKEAAYRAVCEVADRLPDFTADDIWPLLERSGESTHEASALGPVFLRAARAGLIEQTGEMRQTRLSRRHRKLTVWKRT